MPSSLTLTLGESVLFRRLVIFLLYFSSFMVFQSTLLLWFKGLWLIYLCYAALHVSKQVFPCPTVKQIVFLTQQWHVYYKKDKIQVYDSHKIRLEMGICFLLTLESDLHRKTILIFFDQLTDKQYRLLKLIETVRPKLVN